VRAAALANVGVAVVSLSILVFLTVLSVLLMAWALASSARAVGSPRGRFRVGLLVALLIFVITNAVFAICYATVPNAGVLTLLAKLSLPPALFCAVFVGLQYGFKLTFKRTFAPFGAYVALSLVLAGLASFVVRPFVVEPFVVATWSMSPTISPGDRFLVDKIIRPRRLDIVAYWSQETPKGVWCKRVIGLPGDRLRFENGGVYVNDQSITLPAVIAGRCRASPAAAPPGMARYKDGETIVLGPDEFFVIGDLVNNSYDSRLLGPSKVSSLVGVIDWVYWPPSRARIIR
jgi:signal peptidase I